MSRKLEPLADLLRATASDYVVLGFDEIEALIGETLPLSAREHAPVYWSNSSHAAWAWRSAGFRSTRRGVGPQQVAFVRETASPTHRAGAGAVTTPGPAAPVAAAHAPTDEVAAGEADVVLLGCVKTKACTARPAKDLYTSPLFARRRHYAEHSGRPWFIISAAYGLVDPKQVIEPYEQRVADLPDHARAAWGRSVASALLDRMGSVVGLVVEIHAGAAYVEAARGPLEAMGAVLETPLAGLRFGEQLAWYDTQARSCAASATGTHDPGETAPPAPQVPVEQLDVHAVSELGPFRFGWWDGTEEAFDRGWDYRVTAGGRTHQVRHGLGRRDVYGTERVHSVTWLDGQVLVEGVAADDYPTSRSLLSLLKHPGGHRHIRRSADVPPGYQRFEIVDHRAELDAPYSPRSLAVKIHEADLQRWALHAVLRAHHRNAPDVQPQALRGSGLSPAPTSPAADRMPHRYELPPLERRQAVVRALLAHGAELDRHSAQRPQLTGDPAANQFVLTDPFAFLVGVICDQGIVAERAWAAPHELRLRLGHWDLERIATQPDRVRDVFAWKPALGRMVNTIPRWITAAARRVLDRYGGDAGRIWGDQPPAATLIRRLEAFEGISQKKAAMAVELLARILGVPIADFEGSDIAYDVHVRRVFLRAGLTARDDLGEMVRVARQLHPQRPGLLDLPAWHIGRTWCRPTEPACDTCAIATECPQLVQRGNAVTGM